MAKVLYTAEAEVTGGRMEGHGRTCDGALEVDIRIPEGLGGPGGGTNPEQLFAVGFASCFESALAVVARRAKVEAGDAKVASKVEPDAHRRGRLQAQRGDGRDRCPRSTIPTRRRSWSARRTRCAPTPTPRAGTSTWR